jgi:hypothetical protein
MARRFNLRRVKLHRNYNVAEVADLLGVHRLTVHRWFAAGLPKIEDARPYLVHPVDLRAFLDARGPKKQKCEPGEIFCLGCRAPKRPALDMADYIPTTPARGRVCGICPDCGGMIYRAINRATISQTWGGLHVTLPSAEQRLSDSDVALSNVTSNQDSET